MLRKLLYPTARLKNITFIIQWYTLTISFLISLESHCHINRTLITLSHFSRSLKTPISIHPASISNIVHDYTFHAIELPLINIVCRTPIYKVKYFLLTIHNEIALYALP